eukprot:768543-Hanusia_phi.AAC.6
MIPGDETRFRREIRSICRSLLLEEGLTASDPEFQDTQESSHEKESEESRREGVEEKGSISEEVTPEQEVLGIAQTVVMVKVWAGRSRTGARKDLLVGSDDFCAEQRKKLMRRTEEVNGERPLTFEEAKKRKQEDVHRKIRSQERSRQKTSLKNLTPSDWIGFLPSKEVTKKQPARVTTGWKKKIEENEDEEDEEVEDDDDELLGEEQSVGDKEGGGMNENWGPRREERRLGDKSKGSKSREEGISHLIIFT